MVLMPVLSGVTARMIAGSRRRCRQGVLGRGATNPSWRYRRMISKLARWRLREHSDMVGAARDLNRIRFPKREGVDRSA
jgi:hypothetical protein